MPWKGFYLLTLISENIHSTFASQNTSYHAEIHLNTFDDPLPDLRTPNT